jgi:hypothetical protein
MGRGSAVAVLTMLREILIRVKGRSVLEDVQTGCGVHPGICATCSGSFFPGLKQQSRINDNPPPSSAEVRNEWSCISISP